MRYVRGQAAVEFLAVVAFFLLVTIPLFAYFMIAAPQKEYYASLSQAEVAASEFVRYGELVGTQSNGTNITRVIVLPKYVSKINMSGDRVYLLVEFADLSTHVIRKGSVNFSSTEIEVPGGGTYAFTFVNINGDVNVSRVR